MENNSSTYKDNIIEAVNVLVKCHSSIFNTGVNLLMSGELKEIDSVFEAGDVYEFNINHLETSNDANIQLIAQTIRKIRSTIDSVINLNAIKDEEIEW